MLCLPRDVIRHIVCVRLDYYDILNMCRLCKFLRETIWDSIPVWHDLIRRFLTRDERVLMEINNTYSRTIITSFMNKRYEHINDQLWSAARLGYEVFVEKRLSKVDDNDKFKLLYCGLQHGRIGVYSILTKSKPSFIPERFHLTYAIGSRDLEMIKYVHDRIKHLDGIEETYRYCFEHYIASRMFNEEVADYLIEIHPANRHHLHSLTWACFDDVKKLKYLSKHAVPIPINALDTAITNNRGHDEVIRYLVETVGQVPVDISRISDGNLHMIPYLLEHGALAGQVDQVADRIIAKGSFILVEKILDYLPQPNVSILRAVLRLATPNCSEKVTTDVLRMLEILIGKGANVKELTKRDIAGIKPTVRKFILRQINGMK